MVIKTAKTVAEYKKIRDERIQSWIDARFEKGCVTWELINPDEVKITDQTGDSMTVSISEIAWKKRKICYIVAGKKSEKKPTNSKNGTVPAVPFFF